MTLLEMVRRAVAENEDFHTDHPYDCNCGTRKNQDGQCWMREARALLAGTNTTTPTAHTS